MKNYHIIFLSIAVALASCTPVRYASDSNTEFDDIYYVSSDSDPTPVTLEDDYANYQTEQDATQEDYWEGEDTRDYVDPGTGNTYNNNYNDYVSSPWGMTANPYYGWGYSPGFTFNLGYNNFYNRWRPYFGINYGFSTYYPVASSYFYGSGPYYNPWFYNPYYDPFYNPIGYCYNPWIYNPYWSGYANGYGGYNYGSDIFFTGNGAYYGQHSGFNTGSLINSNYTQGAIFNESGKVVASVKPINPSKPPIDRPISAIGSDRPVNSNGSIGRPQIGVDRPTNPAVRPVNPDSRPSNGNTRPSNPQRPSNPRPSTRPSQPSKPSGGTRPSFPRNNSNTRPPRGRGGLSLLGSMLNIGATIGSVGVSKEGFAPRSSRNSHNSSRQQSVQQSGRSQSNSDRSSTRSSKPTSTHSAGSFRSSSSRSSSRK